GPLPGRLAREVARAGARRLLTQSLVAKARRAETRVRLDIVHPILHRNLDGHQAHAPGILRCADATLGHRRGGRLHQHVLLAAADVLVGPEDGLALLRPRRAQIELADSRGRAVLQAPAIVVGLDHLGGNDQTVDRPGRFQVQPRLYFRIDDAPEPQDHPAL